MPDDISRPAKSRPSSGLFGASPDIRLRHLATGAWEVGGPMSDKQIRDERISISAYFLWVEAGRPEGDGKQFWQQAEMLDDLDGDAETGSEDGAPAD